MRNAMSMRVTQNNLQFRLPRGRSLIIKFRGLLMTGQVQTSSPILLLQHIGLINELGSCILCISMSKHLKDPPLESKSTKILLRSFKSITVTTGNMGSLADTFVRMAKSTVIAQITTFIL